MLEQEGFEVDERSEGLSGLQALLDDVDYAFAILDVAMPGLPGPDVLAQARRAGKDVPVVIVSGHLAAEDPPGSRAACLMKPFSAQDLLEAARTAAEGTRVRG
jgi:two-component system response regulator QseB